VISIDISEDGGEHWTLTSFYILHTLSTGIILIDLAELLLLSDSRQFGRTCRRNDVSFLPHELLI
jgi:hypothetical protein